MEVKKCNICQNEKELQEFNRDKYKKDGHMNFCKKCRSDKNFSNKTENNNRSKLYYSNNKESISNRRKKWSLDNKEVISEKWREYRQKNRKRLNQQGSIYRKNKRKLDPLYKLRENIRSLILISIKKQGFSKESKTFEILGCSLDEFKIHLENQFTEGMNWQNMGKWHMDHIKPISLARTENEVIELNHYTNFQPLWAKDNLSKGKKYHLIAQ